MFMDDHDVGIGFRALSERLSPAYLPGVTSLDLPTTTEADPESSPPLDGDAATGTSCTQEPVVNVGSDDEGGAEGGVASGSDEERLQQLLMRPVPVGGKMMCTVTRRANKLKVREEKWWWMVTAASINMLPPIWLHSSYWP